MKIVLHKLLLGLAIFALCLFTGCGDSGVLRMSEGELSTDSRLEIELQEPFFKDDKTHWLFDSGALRDTAEAISLLTTPPFKLSQMTC